MKKNTKQQFKLLVWLFALAILYITPSYSQGVDCKIPAGAIRLTESHSTLESGKTYVAYEDVELLSAQIIIESGATLYVTTGVVVQGDGNMIMNGGTINICEHAGFFFRGSVGLGAHGSDKDAIVNVGSYSFFSINGSLMQENTVPHNSTIAKGVAQIRLSDGAHFNVCSTFTQRAILYPLIKYIGKGNNRASVVTRAQVSGVDGATMSDSPMVNWFAFSSISEVVPDKALLCKEPSQCKDVWPEGLIAEIEGLCGDTGQTSPKVSLTKVGEFVSTDANGGFASVGEKVKYTFMVKNTGTSNLPSVILADKMLPYNYEFVLVNGDINQNNILETDEEWTYELTYLLT
ncbi:DUF7507 domain-containing protein [Myroides pelagicus]|uniref:DUF7507 domain-containing protein n=1 Tax=Myroides pelagicus TaxID=270914 RepID=A0A7K1GMW7_9FLAO|nr:hypothetical protein [Myroides pelagicus]MTH29723.1 hypothetical protein [Myroides pelagicus]